MALLKHFTSKSGKYAIQGYPHKVGLLLHGPPGTGKTSLIKALAQHTRRSIVNVPLARITTNQELMDIMFDQQYCVHGDEVCSLVGLLSVCLFNSRHPPPTRTIRNDRHRLSATHHIN